MTRPAPRFHNFIGQKLKVAFLRRQLGGAMSRGEAFPHTLFVGPSGVGKTVLARALAEESGSPLRKIMGTEDRAAIGRVLAELTANTFLFIDECHRLGGVEQELLYEAIDEHDIPDMSANPRAQEPEGRNRVYLPPWTLVLATDQPGKLLDALTKRVTTRIDLGDYSAGEMREIVSGIAEHEKLPLSAQAVGLLARVANGRPRRAQQVVRQLRLHFPGSEARNLSVDDVRTFLRDAGYDESGLDSLAHRYLGLLAGPGKASLESMSSLLGADKAYVKNQVEADLLKQGLLQILPGGRQLTPKGRQLVAGQNALHSSLKGEETWRSHCRPAANQPAGAVP